MGSRSNPPRGSLRRFGTGKPEGCGRAAARRFLGRWRERPTAGRRRGSSSRRKSLRSTSEVSGGEAQSYQQDECRESTFADSRAVWHELAGGAATGAWRCRSHSPDSSPKRSAASSVSGDDALNVPEPCLPNVLGFSCKRITQSAAGQRQTSRALVSCKPEFGGAKEGVEAKHGREREPSGRRPPLLCWKREQARA